MRDLCQAMCDTAQQKPGEAAVAARSHHDQIGSLLVGNVGDHLRRASRHHFSYLERGTETLLLQVRDLLPERGLDLVLVEMDRTGTPTTHDLTNLNDNEPSTDSMHQILRETKRHQG